MWQKQRELGDCYRLELDMAHLPQSVDVLLESDRPWGIMIADDISVSFFIGVSQVTLPI